jgi:hypothetical protein
VFFLHGCGGLIGHRNIGERFIAACVQSDGTQYIIKNAAARTVRLQNMPSKFNTVSFYAALCANSHDGPFLTNWDCGQNHLKQTGTGEYI